MDGWNTFEVVRVVIIIVKEVARLVWRRRPPLLPRRRVRVCVDPRCDCRARRCKLNT